MKEKYCIVVMHRNNVWVGRISIDNEFVSRWVLTGRAVHQWGIEGLASLVTGPTSKIQLGGSCNYSYSI